MTPPAIAIVGMACQYPDADSPLALWENVLAQRRAFRRMPSERLRLEDYYAPDHEAPDRIYADQAAVLKDYEFDRVRFRVAGSTFRSADMAHWLALDVASRALADAGFPDSEGLTRETTGVILGNTLTGEFSRANVMRLRWPYVRRMVEAQLAEQDWSPDQRRIFLGNLEIRYKAPFPSIDEETLAGGLANTIAGRICNYFDFKGGGYTVDGACASSLLAITNACSALAAHDLDVALAGGVDLSLDPFELVGFAKTSALAPEKMRVYDARSAGFWPGEGCGFVVLMRYEEAVAQQRRIYALIRGWGVSSDGNGGITRPEVEGQMLAVKRAYQRAGFGIDRVAYFEGHGTGTQVGDATELRTLSTARREADPDAPPAVIGSMKANIGHTKAAAGIGGLIKATMALHTQLLPPNTGNENPHPELTGDSPTLRLLSTGQPWPADRPLRAGVSAMGFGGINTHVVLEADTDRRRHRSLEIRDQMLLASAQDAELFLFSAPDAAELRAQVEHLLAFAARLSMAELTDLAATLQRTLTPARLRAAIVADTPAVLVDRLETLQTWLTDGITARLDVSSGLFLGSQPAPPRLGYLFPGQGSPSYLDGGVLRRRFADVDALYTQSDLPTPSNHRQVNTAATVIAQPAIVTASMAALRVLDRLGLRATVAVGHSLGELSALHWAGAMDEQTLLRIATARGQAMMDLGDPTGTMASIGAGCETTEALLNGEHVAIACLNTPRQTVVSGPATEVAIVVRRAQAEGLPAQNIPVSHAFHSPFVAAATESLAEHLAGETFHSLKRPVISTITGASLAPDEDLPTLLCRQVTDPVRFTQAISAAGDKIDLLLEVGPGRVLSNLAAECVDTPIVALDAGGPSLAGLLHAVGAAFALGAPVNYAALFADRFSRPFDLDWQASFLINPCELAPIIDGSTTTDFVIPEVHEGDLPVPDPPGQPATQADEDTLALVRRLVAERVELPASSIGDADRLLSDLHLNSISVSQIVAEAARQLDLPAPVAPTEFANATIIDVAETLDEMVITGGAANAHQDKFPPGVDSWVRSFTVEWIPRALSRPPVTADSGEWQIFAPPNCPLVESLDAALAQAGGNGVIVCLPPELDLPELNLLLRGAHTVLAMPGSRRFVVAQVNGGGAALARTLHLEAPEITTCVVNIPPNHPDAATWVAAEAMSAVGYTESHYDCEGQRWEPVWRPHVMDCEAEEPILGPDDVLLVTGGGKGITAECALSLARETGVRLALMGRSGPDDDAELAANLERMTAAGITYRYLSADVTDMEAVQRAVSEIEASLGPVTGILHGAARNVPQLLPTLDEATVQRTLAPKVQGARNLLSAIDPAQLRLFIAFGSIIAQTGLPGEADYGLANEWLSLLTERLRHDFPACRCMTIDWSVWAGAGMGERLGTLESLAGQGITPIPLEVGVSMLQTLLRQKQPRSVIVSGRFGLPPTIRIEEPELPFRRFLEQVQLHYPGIELVVDATLSGDSDPYLDDHIFQGERLFLAVMGLEAMAQVSMALTGSDKPPVFENVQFKRPIVVPEGESTTIRLAALKRENGQIDIALRSQETSFQVDHFRAQCRFDTPRIDASNHLFDPAQFPTLNLDPNRELYEGLFFHRGRFRRIQGYHQISAAGCLAELSPGDDAPWFSRYLPPDLVLGDPGRRDAAIHGIQVCVPQGTLLPVGVERVIPDLSQSCGPRYLHVRERTEAATDNTLVFDVVVTDGNGQPQEQWQGLKLTMVTGAAFTGPWSPPVLGPYVERRLRDLMPGSALSVSLEQNSTLARPARSDRVIQRALGQTVTVHRRADGKPEVNADWSVSASHAGNLTIAVANPGQALPISCDIEPVEIRSEMVWQDLLGQERFSLITVLTQTAGEDQHTAATRLWAAGECLRKAGLTMDTPLTLSTVTDDGWTLLSAGSAVVATYVAHIQDISERLVLAIHPASIR